MKFQHAAGLLQGERSAVCLDGDRRIGEIALCAVIVLFAGNLVIQAFSVVIIRIDDCLVTDVEQHPLRLIVVLHGLVVVEVILRQIREHCNLEMCRTDALLHEPERADLHHDRIAARIRHFAVEGEQVEGHGCCVVGVDDLVTDLVLDRTDQPDLMPVFRENILNDRGNGRFTVGAGHADEAHLPLRMPEPCRAEIAVFCTGIRDENLLLPQTQIALDHNHCRTVLECLCRGRMSVELLTLDSNVDAALCDLPVIVRDCRDLGISDHGQNSVFQ